MKKKAIRLSQVEWKSAYRLGFSAGFRAAILRLKTLNVHPSIIKQIVEYYKQNPGLEGETSK